MVKVVKDEMIYNNKPICNAPDASVTYPEARKQILRRDISQSRQSGSVHTTVCSRAVRVYGP